MKLETDLANLAHFGSPRLRRLTSDLGRLLHSALRLHGSGVGPVASDEVPVAARLRGPDGEAVHVDTANGQEAEDHVREAIAVSAASDVMRQGPLGPTCSIEQTVDVQLVHRHVPEWGLDMRLISGHLLVPARR